MKDDLPFFLTLGGNTVKIGLRGEQLRSENTGHREPKFRFMRIAQVRKPIFVNSYKLIPSLL